MGGKVLDYEAKTILNLGKAEGQALVFLNLIAHGIPQEDAQALSELSDAQVAVILKESR